MECILFLIMHGSIVSANLLSNFLYFSHFAYSLSVKGEKLWMDKSSVNSAIVNSFKSTSEKNHLDMQVSALCRVSPIAMSKAIKNHAEFVGMCNSHLRSVKLFCFQCIVFPFLVFVEN